MPKRRYTTCSICGARQPVSLSTTEHERTAHPEQFLPAPVVLDYAFIRLIEPAMVETWGQIGCDIEKVEGVNNLMAVEACIDADHLETFTEHRYPDAERAIHCAFRENDYGKVLHFIADHILLY